MGLSITLLNPRRSNADWFPKVGSFRRLIDSVQSTRWGVNSVIVYFQFWLSIHLHKKVGSEGIMFSISDILNKTHCVQRQWWIVLQWSEFIQFPLVQNIIGSRQCCYRPLKIFPRPINISRYSMFHAQFEFSTLFPLSRSGQEIGREEFRRSEAPSAMSGLYRNYLCSLRFAPLSHLCQYRNCVLVGIPLSRSE